MKFDERILLLVGGYVCDVSSEKKNKLNDLLIGCGSTIRMTVSELGVVTKPNTPIAPREIAQGNRNAISKSNIMKSIATR